MYTLKRNARAREAFARGREIASRTLRKVTDATIGLEFDPEEHLYRFYGRTLTGVSTIVEAHTTFDPIAASEKASKNARHPLFGHDPEEIRKIWSDKGKAAADAGTLVHAFGEACCLLLEGREDELPQAYADRLGPDGLSCESPKEEALARWWDSLDWDTMCPVLKETPLVNPLVGYAGTPDLLFANLRRGTFHQKDYKTNEDLFRWYGSYLKAPLSCLKDNDIGKYTVQQTLYGAALRQMDVPVATMDLVWLRPDGEFQEVPLPLQYEKLVLYAASLVTAARRES